MRGARDDQGITLVELVVAATLTMTVLGALVGIVASTVRVVDTTTARTALLADTRTAQARIQRDLRVAVSPGLGAGAIIAANDRELSFFASLGRSSDVASPPLTRVWYWVDGSPGEQCLRRAAAPALLGATGVDMATPRPAGSCLVAGTINPDAGTALAPAVFRYESSPARGRLRGSPLGAPSASSAGTALSAEDLARVEGVVVDLRVTSPRQDAAQVRLTSTVTLTNVVNDRRLREGML